jgi:hypothetical protein
LPFDKKKDNMWKGGIDHFIHLMHQRAVQDECSTQEKVMLAL